MSITNEFVTLILAKLHDELSEDQIESVKSALIDCCNDYEIARKNTSIVPSEGFVPEWYGIFIARKKVAGRAVSTLRLYNYYIMDFFLNMPVPLDEMDSTLMIKYLYDYQKRKGVGNNTLDHCRIILNTFFQWAANEGYIKNNFVGNIDPIKYTERPREPLTEEEMVMLRDACETYRERAIVDVFLSTGMRIGEITKLKWEDINMQKKTMTVFGKGSKYRTVFFNSSTKVSLLKYKLVRPGEDPYVFVTDTYPFKRLSVGGMSRVISELNKRKTFSTHVSAHVLRHTFATQALAHGMSLEKLKTLLGHENVATTLIYTKVDMSQVEYEYQKCFGL